MKPQKRVFGLAEIIFDAAYLLAAAAIGIVTLYFGGDLRSTLVAAAAFVLAGGDVFHLAPRMLAIRTGNEERYARAMGIGKLVTSITMTVFYLLLWHIRFAGVQAAPRDYTRALYFCAVIRIVLCLLPQNRWLDRKQPLRWALYRNIPFIIMGAYNAVAYMIGGWQDQHVSLAIALSFVFYLPVVFLAGKKPKIGMLMLPKTCAYIWMLAVLSPMVYGG